MFEQQNMGPYPFGMHKLHITKMNAHLFLLQQALLQIIAMHARTIANFLPSTTLLLTMASLLQYQITQEAKLKALHKQREVNKQIGIDRKSRKDSDNEVQV
jgi:hypothetical protein